jgi:hypothetical protein
MAKKSPTLTFRDIVLGADADTIRQAHEARVKIDQLIDERQKAYERIAAIETQVEEVIGEPGVFPFPAPPLPVAGFDPKAEFATRAGAAPKKPSAGARSAATGGPGNESDDDEDASAPAAPTAPLPPASPTSPGGAVPPTRKA